MLTRKNVISCNMNSIKKPIIIMSFLFVAMTLSTTYNISGSNLALNKGASIVIHHTPSEKQNIIGLKDKLLSTQPNTNLNSNNNNNNNHDYNTNSNSLSSIASSSDFISTWNTSITSPGSSNSSEITLPLQSTGTYDFTVNWGDLTTSSITSWNQANVTHNYSSKGIYTITINGTLNGWAFKNSGDKLKIIDITQWGDLQLGNSGGYFYGSSNLLISALDAPNLSNTNSMNRAFDSCITLQMIQNDLIWNVSTVTDMGQMFFNDTHLYEAFTSWNVSSVTNMTAMFTGDSVLNVNSLGSWDVSKVTDMAYMFAASSFNGAIGSWNVSKVTDMSYMFASDQFNQSIVSWDVSSVTNMSNMFAVDQQFNQAIGSWNVSKVTNMSFMFFLDNFNQPLGAWNVGSVTDMSGMFAIDQFNQAIGSWNVSKVKTMDYLFYYDNAFEQPIGSWNVHAVTNMTDMFNGDTLSTPNYDNLLNGWSNLALQSNVVFDAGNSMYSSASESARQYIITTFSWIITDGGLSSSLSSSSTTTTTSASTSRISSSNTNSSSTSGNSKNSPGFEFSIVFLAFIGLVGVYNKRKKDI